MKQLLIIIGILLLGSCTEPKVESSFILQGHKYIKLSINEDYLHDPDCEKQDIIEGLDSMTHSWE